MTYARILIAIVTLWGGMPTAGAATLWVLNAHLIDGLGGHDVPLVDVAVDRGRIAAIRPAGAGHQHVGPGGQLRRR